MPQLIIEVVADPRKLTRGLQQATASTKKFSREMDSAGRGVLSGTGLMKSFGRSVAFASGGFIAFQGASKFLTDSVNAAREAGVAQRSLAAQMQAAGESFKANREAIDEAARSYAQFGFQNDEVIQSLTVLERGTGKINDALKLEMLAADIARARNLELAQAATVVAKVFGGQETALRRVVPGLEKTAHGWDLVREAQQKMAGQAAAATTPVEQFQASLHDTQETIGKALVPVLDKFLTKLTDAMTKFNEAANSQKGTSSDLRKTAHLFGEGLHFAGVGAQFFSDHVTIANKNLERAKFLFKEIGDFNDRLFPPELSKRMETFTTDLQTLIETAPKPKYRDLTKAGGIVIPADVTPADIKKLFPGPYQASADEKARRRQQWFDAVIGRADLRASLLPTLTAQIAAYKEIVGKLKARVAVTKDATRQLTLEDQVLQYGATIAGLQAQRAADLKAKSEQAAADRKAAAEAARQEHIGWLEFAYERAQVTKTLSDDLKTAKINLDYWKKQAATGKRTLEEAQQVFHWQQEIKNLRNKQPQGPEFKHLATSQILAALPAGLSPAAVRRMVGLLSTVGPGGSVPGFSGQYSAAGARPVYQIQNLHLNGVSDVKGMEEQLVKRTKARPTVRRGTR
jgi:hypothetical protein